MLLRMWWAYKGVRGRSGSQRNVIERKRAISLDKIQVLFLVTLCTMKVGGGGKGADRVGMSQVQQVLSSPHEEGVASIAEEDTREKKRSEGP